MLFHHFWKVKEFNFCNVQTKDSCSLPSPPLMVYWHVSWYLHYALDIVLGDTANVQGTRAFHLGEAAQLQQILWTADPASCYHQRSGIMENSPKISQER